jgi:tricarballylate dehydrogenase
MGQHPSERVDVVVAGAGCGLVAAIKAAEHGAKVVVLDKLGPMLDEEIVQGAPPGTPGSHGNCTAKSGQQWYYMVNVALHKPAVVRTTVIPSGSATEGTEGIVPQEFDKKITQLDRYKELSQGRTDIELAKVVFQRSMDDAKWLRKNIGLLQEKASGLDPEKPKFSRHILPDLYEAAERRGIKLLFEHEASELLTDSDGRVTGIRARTPDGLKDFEAAATILATGSFEGSREMKIKYLDPDKADALVTGCHTNTGDGLMMAMKLGANLVNMTATHLRTPDAVVHGGGPTVLIPGICTRGLYINKNGKRFVDENRDSDQIANAIVHQPDQKVYLLFDEKTKVKFSKQYDRYVEGTIRYSYRPVAEDELMIRADSVEDLAEKIGISYQALKATVDEFNAAVQDEQAQGIPYLKSQRAVTVDQAPFYAHPVTCGLNHPLGGLKINTEGQVMSTEDVAIPGLYACGALVNFHFGETIEIDGEPTYVSSYGTFPGLGYSFATACLAGETAARQACRDGGTGC